jgi:hypothetical protein
VGLQKAPAADGGRYKRSETLGNQSSYGFTMLLQEGFMNKERLLTILTVINLGILVLLVFVQLGRVQASGPAAVLRGGALEIVDAQGMVRASLHIEPAGPRA